MVAGSHTVFVLLSFSRLWNHVLYCRIIIIVEAWVQDTYADPKTSLVRLPSLQETGLPMALTRRERDSLILTRCSNLPN